MQTRFANGRVLVFCGLLVALGIMQQEAFGEPAPEPKTAPLSGAKVVESTLRFEYGSGKQNQSQVDRFSKHLADHPEDVDALIARGSAYYAVRDFHRGDADVSKAIELEPKNPRAWHARGHGLSVRDKFDEAIAAFDRAIEFGSSDPKLNVERAMTFELSGDRDKALTALSEAIERNPKNAEAYFCRAELLNTDDQWERAQVDYQKAIELDPKKLVYRVGRSIAYFQRDEIDRGIADTLEAMRLHPGDAGVDYEPTSNKPLSEEALRHGEEQVRRMLTDRPAMADHVSPGDKLWTWAVRKFAGEDLGSLIDWDPGSPAPFAGRSSPPDGLYRGSIQVAATRLENGKDLPRAFEDLWSTAVFELHNITSDLKFQEVEKQRDEGKLTREQYILAMLNVEELATQKTRAFYLKYAVPWLKSQNRPLGSPYLWECTSFNTAGDVRTDVTVWGDDSRIPWYASRYDIAAVYRDFSRGDYQAARKALDPLMANADSLAPDSLHDALQYLGCIELAEQNVETAMDALDRAIKVAPDNVRKSVSHYVKGDAELSRWNYDRAIAEYSAAIKVNRLSVEALSKRSWAYSRRGELDAAIKDVDAAIELQPRDAALYVYRGNFWIDKRDYTRAVNDFTKAIELAPDSADGYRGRANANYDRGETDAALQDWDAAIARNADDYALFIERGSLHQAKRHFKQSWDDYSAAIKLAPDQPEGFAYRAELALLEDGKDFFRPADAFVDAQRACEITQWKSATELALLAKACAAKQELEEAVKWQQQALENAEPLARRQALTDLEKYRRQQQPGRKE